MPSQLPPAPEFLHEPAAASASFRALQALHAADPSAYFSIFSQAGAVVSELKDSQARAALVELESLDLVQHRNGCFVSDYLVTPWGGAFYVTDLPDTGVSDEVFSPHPETRFFSMLLQARAGDSVLDLGTGSGILLLEAARRGATGLGIDRSPRAVAFARANAALNGLQENVSFDNGDFTDPAAYAGWGRPAVVVSNPPFEPIPEDPGGFSRPIHSEAGVYGTDLVQGLLAALRQWCHQPALFQTVLFSLGRNEDPRGDHLLVTDDLKETALSLKGVVEMRELLPPITIDEYLSLNFGGNRHSRGRVWLSQMERERFRTLHLLFADIYANGAPVGTNVAANGVLRWFPYLLNPQEDECFLWPLASSRRERVSRGATTAPTSRSATGK